MKKCKFLSAIILVMLCVSQVKSQETEVITEVKKEAKWGTELNFNPFSGNLSLNNTTGQIKVRRFLNNNLALRTGVLFSLKNFSDEVEQKYGQEPYTESSSRQSVQTTVNFGFEKHLGKNKRLSPYIGAEILIGYKTSTHEDVYNDKKRTVKGAWEQLTFNYNGQYSYYTSTFYENGYLSAGVNVLSGFDFYMAENFYFGLELGFIIEFISNSDIEVTTQPGYSEYSQTQVPNLKSSSWRITPHVANGVRIGYNF